MLLLLLLCVLFCAGAWSHESGKLSMPLIKVGYTDGASYFGNYFRDVLRRTNLADLTFVRDPAPEARVDILLFSVFGTRHRNIIAKKRVLLLYESKFQWQKVGNVDVIVCGFRDCNDRAVDAPPERLPKNVYLPLFAACFSEINMQTENALIVRKRRIPLNEKPHFAAYMYSNCEAKYREEFFDALVAAAKDAGQKPPRAVGRCQGSSTPPLSRHLFDRSINSENSGDSDETTYLDLAIKRYESYRWAIVFENHWSRHIEGYVSEKMTSAMLAETIPIYYGAPDVGEIFNPASFVNCRAFDTLRACADEVVRIDSDAAAYQKIQAEPWVLDRGDAASFLDRNKVAQILTNILIL